MFERIELEKTGNLPFGCEIVSHKNYGNIFFKNIGWLVNDEPFSVIDYEQEINQETTWNSAVRDWLLASTRRIPKSLSGFKLCLLGTMYQKDGRRFFEYLYKEGNAWITGIHYLDQKLTPDFIIPCFENN